MQDNNQKIDLEKYNSEHIMSLYNKIFDDENILNVKGDGNCWIWSVIQAVRKKKMEYTEGDYNLMRKIRQMAHDLGYCENHKEKCIKNDGIYSTGDNAFTCYKKVTGHKNFSFTTITPTHKCDSFFVTYSSDNNECYKQMFIDLKNGGPAVIAKPVIIDQIKHYKTVNWENRDEFCRKLLELLMSKAMRSIQNKDSNEIKNYFVRSIVDPFFSTNEDEQEYDENELVDDLDKIFDGVKDKKDKYMELIKFFYSEFERVYIDENKTPKANEFLSMLLKNFKEKYIISSDENNYDKIWSLYNQTFNDGRFASDVKGDGNCWIWSAIQAVRKKKMEYTEGDYKLMREIRQEAHNSGCHYNGEGGCIKDDGVWFEASAAFRVYDELTDGKEFSNYTVIDIAAVNNDIRIGIKHCAEDSNDNKTAFINLKNGGPAVIFQTNHYRSVYWENRDELCHKLLELICCNDIYQAQNKELNDVKEHFMCIMNNFFRDDEDYDENELVDDLDKIFDGVKDKKDKYMELIKFFYSEFERVYIDENKTPKANEFLSMLLKNFKEKYIISSDENNYDKIWSLYNQTFNDGRFASDVKGDGNCWIWSAIQAVRKKKMEYTEGDYKLMREIRQEAHNSGCHYNGEGGCIKDDGVWFDGAIAFKYYKKLTNNKDLGYTVITPQEGTIGIKNEKLPMLPGVTYVNKKGEGLRGMFINLKNGGPAIIAQNRHYRTINWENRDEFCLKLLRIIMYRDMYKYREADAHDIKSCFTSIIGDFFYVNDKDTICYIREFSNSFDEMFENIEDKKDKYMELIKFFYSEFQRVYLDENKTPKAKEFLSMLLKNFKEKYIFDSKNKIVDNGMELNLKSKLETFFSKDSNGKYNKEKQLEILNSADDELKYGLLNLDKVLGDGYEQKNSILDCSIFLKLDDEVQKKLVEKQIIDYGKFDSLTAPVVKLFLDKNYICYISDENKKILCDTLKREAEFFINLPLETKEILNNGLKLDLKYDKDFEGQKRSKYINMTQNKGKVYINEMFFRTDPVSLGYCPFKASIQASDGEGTIDFSIKENKDRLDKFKGDVVKKYPAAYSPGCEDGYWGDPRYAMLYLSEEKKITTAVFHIYSKGKIRKLSICLFKSGDVQAKYTRDNTFPGKKIKSLCIKDLCDSVLSGCPVVLANYFESDGSHNHVQSLKNNKDERREFLKSVIEILYNELIVEDFSLFVDYNVSDSDDDFVSVFLKNLFGLDEKDEEAIETKINDTFKYVDGIFRIYRKLELGEFLVKEFGRIFIDSEDKNKDLSFNDFFNGVLERFEKECPVKKDWLTEKENDLKTKEKEKTDLKNKEEINSCPQEIRGETDPNEYEQELNNKINELWDSKNLDELEKYYKNLADDDKQKFAEAAEDKAIKQAKEINEKLKNLELDFEPIKTYLKNCTNLFCDEKNRKEILDQIEKLDVMRFYNYISELIRRIFNFEGERSKFGFKRLKEIRALRKLNDINTKILAPSNTLNNKTEYRK